MLTSFAISDLINLIVTVVAVASGYFALRSDNKLLRAEMRFLGDRQKLTSDAIAAISQTIQMVAVQKAMLDRLEEEMKELRNWQFTHRALEPK